MSLKKPHPTIGVDNYTFFPLTSDAAEGAVYGTAVAFPGTVEISPTDNADNYTFDADNGAYETLAYIESMGHEITNADIPPEVEAQWRGLTLKNGGVEYGGNANAPYFGVAWRILKADNTYRYIRYYKGKYAFASHVGGQTKPSEGAPEAQTAQATYSAVKRDFDDKAYYVVDEADFPTGLTREAFEASFFSDMSYYPEGLGTLTVTSVAGTNVGDTTITVAETAGTGNSFVYKVGDTAESVTYEQDLTSWTALTSGSDVTAAGKIITVAEVTSSKKAVKVGSATVTAKSV